MTDLTDLEVAMVELRTLVARDGNDFAWSSWTDQPAAIAEIDRYIAAIRKGVLPNLGILLAPTGPVQELSLSSGWADEYLDVANRIERALTQFNR